MPDLIGRNERGYIARYGDNEDLAKGIGWVLDMDDKDGRLRKAARAHALNCYSLETIAKRYAALYEELLQP